MRKHILSFFVIGGFIMYSLYAHVTGMNRAPAVASQNMKPIQTPEPTGVVQKQEIGTPAPVPNTPLPTPVPPRGSGYKDGAYIGDTVDAYYGYVQIQATISGGRIADVRFLQYPNDRETSIYINSQAMPILKQEAIQAQSANVDIVSGATDTSQAFIQSLQSALNRAKG